MENYSKCGAPVASARQVEDGSGVGMKPVGRLYIVGGRSDLEKILSYFEKVGVSSIVLNPRIHFDRESVSDKLRGNPPYILGSIEILSEER